MNIYLIRHGQDKDNAADILNGQRNEPLTELGKQQAQNVANKIVEKDYAIDTIYSSPLLRASQTADIIAKTLGHKNIIFDEELVERDFGILTGKSKSDNYKYCSSVVEVGKEVYGVGAKDAETFSELLIRADHILKKIKSDKKSNIIIVAHRDILQMVQAAHFGWSWEEGLKHPIDNANITELK
ncbi:MAG: histidine phosphatase family protein [Chloroflexota bacterium]|nr:MAG: histidine phosphatase family protein [Chloroflexota bacterium]